MTRNLIIIIIFSWLVISFTKRTQLTGDFISSEEVQIDTLPGTSPYLTKDNNGNTVLSWVRMMNDSNAVLCYSIINNGNIINTVTIPASSTIHAHAENLPKVIFKPSGEIIAVWGVRNPNPANKYSGLIYYSQSFDEGVTWSVGRKLVTDPAGFDQRYSDVALLGNGEVAIIWLDNRKSVDHEGSAVYSAITDGDKGFRNEKLVSEPACQCCRTSLYVDGNDNIHVVYRGILNDSIRDMVHVVSRDGGRTFSAPKKIFNDNWVLKGCPHTGPSMVENGHGLHFAWFTGGSAKGSYYIRSVNNGNSFAEHDHISRMGMHPQLSALPGGELVIVWDETFEREDQYFKRICIQVRSEEGADPVTAFITGEMKYNTYPVVSPINDNAVLVAYSAKDKNKEYVKWQRVSLGL